jgi:hypothetical protein
MAYVIRRLRDGQFVTLPGSECSYTNDIDKARAFDTEQDAIAQCCSNEYVQKLQYVGAFRHVTNDRHGG